MDIARLLRIGNRIHLLLEQELGRGIDVQRLIHEPLYARDVLLVCDAMPGSDLASLAQHFRTALARAGDDAAPASGFGADSSGGFGTSRPRSSDFGALAPPTVARRWTAWFGGR